MTRHGKRTDSEAAHPARTRDRERTRQRILEAAYEEFAENGLAGGNTDTIAAAAGVTKRLVFYYFGSKEALFVAVLEMAYGRMRSAEENLNLDTLDPETAIRRLVAFTFDFDQANPRFVRLVTIENIHRGRHIAMSERLREMTRPIVDQIARVLEKGAALGAIRPGLDPREVHMTLNALCFFSVANRSTFEAQFALDMTSRPALARRRVEIADLVWRYVRSG